MLSAGPKVIWVRVGPVLFLRASLRGIFFSFSFILSPLSRCRDAVFKFDPGGGQIGKHVDGEKRYNHRNL
jgi:hypothetical protein